MTDKQIKDGIDVSQCECYSIEYNSCNDTLSGSCMKEKCQTFRLLQTIKAKEQECEELKLDLIEAKAHSDYLNNLALSETLNLISEQLDQLKAELTRANCQIADDEILQCDMREAIEELKAENENLQKEYWKLEQGNDFLAEKNSRLRCCLTEIKEIIHFNKTNRLSGGAYISIEQILQKISECEV